VTRVAPRLFLRTMTGRDPAQAHRASTPLELLFDLCFVVAVSQAAAELHGAIGSDHIRHAIAGYVTVFFAIWWAWLNFTWFASAYDTDDIPYRLLTFVQIAGVLVLASGVHAAFDGGFRTITIGYVIMRLALTAQWLRAAVGDVAGRRTALRYVAGLAITQLGWVVRLALPASWGYATFAFLVACELALPYWAEHRGGLTPWHPEHIAERYGLFTIIVLGECVLAAFVAINAGISAGGYTARLMTVSAAGLVAMFGLWWTYFRLGADEMLRERSHLAFVWGYGHYFLFAAIAAFGAGIALVADLAVGHAPAEAHHLTATTQALAFSVPVAIALLLLALMRPLIHGSHHVTDLAAYAAAALVLVVAVLAGSWGLSVSLSLVAATVVAAVAVDLIRPRRQPAEVTLPID
jgi:low temperature requirement protein LtrA